MTKICTIAALLALGTLQQAPEKFTAKVAGNPAGVTGIVVGGQEYVPLSSFAALMGGTLTNGRDDKGAKEITVTIATPKATFDEDPDSSFVVDGDTSKWINVANSGEKIRIRDFIRNKDSWDIRGEMQVARQSLLAGGRIPRDQMTLSFYVVFRDKEGKTIGRQVIEVKEVSYDGGRYPITVNTMNSTSHLPETISIRFNSAIETGGELIPRF